MAAIHQSSDATLDYSAEPKPFDYGAGADLFPAKGRMSRRQIIGYRRFGQAADAIRFAIEEMPAGLLLGTYLEIDEARFDSRAIRRLYDSIEYPLARRAAAYAGC